MLHSPQLSTSVVQMAKGRVLGGRKLDAFLRKAKAARNVREVQVGFFASSRYPDGTPVTNVAAFNEFGTERKGRQHVPERPFFRQSIAIAEDELPAVLRRSVDPKTMVVTRRVAGRLGAAFQGIIQSRIVKLQEPQNAPSTKLRKGSGNPLLDTGQLLGSVTYRVEG